MGDLDDFFRKVLNHEIGSEAGLTGSRSVGGGCIHHGVRLISDSTDYFLKWNRTDYLEMFATEIKGLRLLGEQQMINVPNPIGCGQVDDKSYLLMEFIAPAPRSGTYWSDFGINLAGLHRNTTGMYGLDHNNYIGSLPQSNDPDNSWINFFIQKRLNPQLKRAFDRQLIDRGIINKFDRFYALLPSLLKEERPSLLHGDLWSGNVLTGPDGKVCIIDPAAYYGHREIELAFTRLFGGFDRRFYEAYHQAFNLEKGYEERFDIYNIYPLLVHVNLFGSSYLPGIKSVLAKYVK